MRVPRLALFDLDGTLLDGDTDDLWCRFLIDEGLLDRATFEPANREVAARYAEGRVTAHAFCDFYAATMAGRSAAGWASLRSRFLAARVEPLLNTEGRRAIAAHRAAGDRVVITTATNRCLVEPIAATLGVADLIATELELGVDGAFSGRTSGVLNMREGKVERLRRWLSASGEPALSLDEATFYSDSANDLPLLQAVGHAVAVDPDERLGAAAARRGWPIARWKR